MKLTKIEIVNFGKFTHTSFSLTDNATIFVGPNEAGKSTILAFIKQILFGFYLKSRSSLFFENYRPLRHAASMGGSLTFINAQGQEFRLTRLWAQGDKTKKGELTVFLNGQQVPASTFFAQFHDIDGDFYTDSFIFNQDTLAQITGLQKNELLERIYYLGASQSGRFLQLRDQFAREAAVLFKPTGRKPEVNRLLREMQAQKEKIADLIDEFSQYQQENGKLARQNEALAQKQAQLLQLQKQAANLSKLAQKKASYRQLQVLLKKQENLQFTPQNYQQAQELTAQIASLEANNKEYQQQLGEKETKSTSALKGLLAQENVFLQMQAELNNLQAEKQLLEKNQEQLLRTNPALAQLQDLSPSQRLTWQKESQKYAQTSPKPESKSQPILLVAALLAVFSVLTTFFSLPLAAGGGVMTVLVFAWGLYLKGQEKTQLQNYQRQVKQAQNWQKKHGNLSASELTAALALLGEYQLQIEKIAQNKQRQKQLSTEIESFRLKLQQCLSHPVTDFSLAWQKANKLLQQLQAQQQQREILQQSVQVNNSKIKDLKLKLLPLFVADKVESMPQYQERYQKYLQQKEIDTQITALKNELGPDLRQLQQLDAAVFKQRQENLTQQTSQLQTQIKEEQGKAAEIKVQMQNLADSDRLFTEKQKLETLKAQFKTASQDYLANQLASACLTKFLDLASNQRFPKMLKLAQDYFKLLTSGKYLALSLEKKLKVKTATGQQIGVEYLSRGTGEQLYFALKLAFVDTIRDQINLPLLIDDSFVNFDQTRTQAITSLLNKIRQKNQLLLFTTKKELADSFAGQTISLGAENNA